MRKLVIVALLAAACQTPDREVPEGRIDTKLHPDFDTFRPVQIAVLPVEAPSFGLRKGIRRAVYDGLVHKRYSPFKLRSVDKHTDSTSKFDPGSLEVDAIFVVKITSWKPVSGTQYWAGDGTAELRHDTGDVIWSCGFTDYAFEIRARAGQLEDDAAARKIAALFLERLPEQSRLMRR